MKISRIAMLCCTFPFALLILGCDAANNVEVVDLNKVLDALVAVLDENAPKPSQMDGDAAGSSVASIAAAAANVGADSQPTQTAEVVAIAPDKQDPEKEASFLKKYAAKLNEMKVLSVPVGVSMTAGGEIVGFRDPNANGVQDADESKEFTVTIDTANSRLIASDNHGYHRPYGYRPSGMMMGYMLGSMMGRQHSYYSGAMASSRPTFHDKPMSPSNYHSQATSSVRSKVSASRSVSSGSGSARVRTGSKGFSFGK